jgi:hypothetical protein
MPAVNDVGKPCAGEPHARIDGRELETEPQSDHGHGEEQPLREIVGSLWLCDLLSIKATAPVPDPPHHGFGGFVVGHGLSLG